MSKTEKILKYKCRYYHDGCYHIGSRPIFCSNWGLITWEEYIIGFCRYVQKGIGNLYERNKIQMSILYR